MSEKNRLTRAEIDALWAMKDNIKINAEFQAKYDKAYDRNPELGYILTKGLIAAEHASDVDELDEAVLGFFENVDAYYRLIICSLKDQLDEANDDKLSVSVNEIYSNLAGVGYDVHIRLLSDYTENTLDALLTYIEESYEEIQDELKQNSEYLINLPTLNVVIKKVI